MGVYNALCISQHPVELKELERQAVDIIKAIIVGKHLWLRHLTINKSTHAQGTHCPSLTGQYVSLRADSASVEALAGPLSSPSTASNIMVTLIPAAPTG